jgi:hypothetical protein
MPDPILPGRLSAVRHILLSAAVAAAAAESRI